MSQAAARKLRLGWFSFTCCEDSTIIFTELLNEHYQEWQKLIDFCHLSLLKKNNTLKDLDVAFVEGAIASTTQAKRLQTIRANCQKLIAVGACAITALPAGQRNLFDQKTKQEISPLLDHFGQQTKVQSLKELVKVDGEVPGCPMDEEKFLKTLAECLDEFGAK